MSSVVEILLCFLGFLGHVSVCVAAVNRIQGSVADHSFEKIFKRSVYLWALLGLVLPFFLMWRSAELVTPWQVVARQLVADWGYFTLATAWLVVVVIRRLAQLVVDRCPDSWALTQTKVYHIAEEVVEESREKYYPESNRSFLLNFTGNQVGQLEVNKKTLFLPQLPSKLEGLTLTHFSDLHITGVIPQVFYDRLCDEILELDSDLMFLTGDVLDVPSKLPWVSRLAKRLTTSKECYFVLGNHDVRHGQDEKLRAALVAENCVDLGSTYRHVDIRGEPILLAGNELPWVGTAPECRPKSNEFAIGVVHTPDLIGWGRQQDYDLLLAGHAHGGQIRIPGIGPIICPSVHGVRYASGVFQKGRTLMHVSRGISGLQPIRLRCRPELTQLTLRRPDLHS
ncbi:MAG: metallophosphoesterase [Pirellulales bacterium]|nr:metallophosphoesterase [Pirellulales bacterium]